MGLSTIERRREIYERTLAEALDGVGLTADRTTFLTTVSPGALIATLLPPFGVGTTFALVGAAPAQLALASGGRIVAGNVAPTSGASYEVKVRATSADGRREVAETIGFRARLPVVVPDLGPLTLAASTIVENAATGTVIGGILGRTAGSMLALTGSAGARFAVAGSNIVAGATATDYEGATSHEITIRETLGDKTRDTTLTIEVANVFEKPDLQPLAFATASLKLGTPASGAITGATAGSTITAAGLPAGVSIDGAARTWTYDGGGTAGTWDITLTETLGDSANSPRPTTFEVAVAADEEPAPENVVAPSISGLKGAQPVVGETAFANVGTWTGHPASFNYQWRRGGVNILGANGPSYTVTDQDAGHATKGVLDVIVQAINTAGSRFAVSAETGICRRTFPTIGYRIGALTKNGYGSVTLANRELGLLGLGAAAPTTWTTGTATAGSDNHWTKTDLKTPQPNGAGDTADLSSGTYVFPLTATFADGVVETQILTITIVPNTATIGEANAALTASLYTALGGASGVSGKAIEFATGGNFRATAPRFRDWFATAETFIRYADPARPSKLAGIEAGASSNLTFTDLIIGGATNPGFRVWVSGQTISAGAGTSTNVKFLRCAVVNAASEAGVNPAFRIGNSATNCLFEDCSSVWAYNVFSADPASTPVNIVVNRLRARYFYDNFAILGNTSLAPTSYTFNDCVAMSPTRLQNNATHLDGFQLSDGSGNCSLTINRFMQIQADGNAYTQGPLWNGGMVADGANANTVVINGAIAVTRAIHGISFGYSRNWNIRNVTLWKTSSGGSPAPGTSTENDSVQSLGPWFFVTGAPADPAKHTGASSIDKAIVFSTMNTQSVSAWSVGAAVSAHGATLSSPAVGTGFAVTNPMAALDALDYVNMTFDAIVNAVKGALTPAAGGAYTSGGVVTRGALNTDGSWVA